MRTILYAKGLKTADGEDEFNQNAEKDEKFLDRVMDDFRWAGGHYRARNLEFDRQEDWYHRKHYDKSQPVEGDQSPGVGVDSSSNISDEHLVTINVPFSSVQRAHTMMTGETPTIEVLSKKRMANSVVQMLHGVIDQNTRRGGTNPFHDAIFNQLLYGWGIVRTTWNREKWEDPDSLFKGDRPSYEFPIRVESLNPRDCYPIPGGTRERWKAVMHVTHKKVFEIEDEWDVELNHSDSEIDANIDNDNFDANEPLSPSNEVPIIDYWAWDGNEIIHAVIANEQYVMRPAVMKYYDSLPYTIFFCASTTSEKGELYGLSANYALVDSVSELEWLVNRQMRITDLYADPKLILVKVNDEPIPSDWSENSVLELVDGESARYLQFDGTLPDLTSLQQFFRTMLEEEGFGLSQVGESGLDTIAQQQAALIKIFKPVENAESAWVDVNAKVIGLLQRYSWNKSILFEGTMRTDDEEQAFSFNLKGMETKGMRSTRVSLRARFPLEELRNTAAASTLKNSKLMSTERIQKQLLHIANPEKEQEEIRKNTIQEDPQLIQAVVGLKLQTLQQRSTIMEVIAEEAVAISERGDVAQQGAPESPAPLSPTGDVESAITEALGGVSGPPDNVDAAAGAGPPLDGIGQQEVPLEQ